MKTTTWATWATWWLSGLLLTTLAAFIDLVPGRAAPAPEVPEETFQDRTAFIPSSIFQPQQGKVIGVLVGDCAALLGRERRGDAGDAYGFAVNGNSYRRVHVPAVDFFVPYALVEIEVNDSLGAPADESFVATNMTRLDGTNDYPFKVAEVVDGAKKRYDGWLRDHERVIDDAMAQAQTKAVKKADKDAKPALLPRQTDTVMYVTWMTETQRLQVRFLTRILADILEQEPDPVDGTKLPRRPRDPEDGPKLPRRPPGQEEPDLTDLLRRFRGGGTQFGVEFGVAYEISESSSVEKILTLPIQSFENVLPRRERNPLDKEHLAPRDNSLLKAVLSQMRPRA